MKVDGVGKIVEGVNALEAALNSNRVKKVIVLDTKLNKSNKFNFLIEGIKKQNIEIEIVKDNKLWEFHSRHNIVGICEEKEIFDEKNFENIISEKILILDHFQDTNMIFKQYFCQKKDLYKLLKRHLQYHQEEWNMSILLCITQYSR